MKWINLADRLPIFGPDAIIYRIRKEHGGCDVFTDSQVAIPRTDNPRYLSVSLRRNSGFDLIPIDKIEWLDESEDIPEGFMRIDVPIGSYVMPPPTEYMKTPKSDYPMLEYVVLTEMHDDLIDKYETLLAKYNKLKNKK